MNKEAEYEATILAILALKELEVKRLVLHGDSKLVIKKMTGEYRDRHPRMRSYQNASRDLIECFKECSLNLIPIVQNCVVDSLATSTTTFWVPMHPVGKYEIELRHRPYVPDNVKNWQVFKDDK